MKSLGVRYGFVQRSKGHTAARRSAYQRDRFVQGKNSTKLFFNLEEKHLHSGIAVPGNAEAWCSDAVELWERAALAEKRRDAVEARTLDLTLSRKLSEFTMIAICKSIANSFARLGIAVQFDVHISIAADGQHNPHAHFLLSTRKISGEGFDKYKCHDLDKIFSKGRGRFLRQNLATLINQYSTKYDGQPVVYAEKRVNERTPEPRLPRWRAKTAQGVQYLKLRRQVPFYSDFVEREIQLARNLAECENELLKIEQTLNEAPAITQPVNSVAEIVPQETERTFYLDPVPNHEETDHDHEYLVAEFLHEQEATDEVDFEHWDTPEPDDEERNYHEPDDDPSEDMWEGEEPDFE